MLDPRRPFLRADALAAGLTDRHLQSSRFQRLHVGVYLAADVELTPSVRAQAALLPFCADAFASHATAARLLRVPIPALPDEHVTVPNDRDRRRRTGVRSHQAPTGSAPSVVLVDGIRASGPAQLFAELAAQLSLVDLVVSSGIYADPGRTLERIHRLLLARRLPGVPKRLHPGWRRHFPGRS